MKRINKINRINKVNRIKKKIAILLSTVLLLMTVMPMTAWADEITWETALNEADANMKATALTDDDGAISHFDDNWATFARARNLDADHTEDYYIQYYEKLDTDELTSSAMCSKALLALRAMGRGDSDKANIIKDKLITDDPSALCESPAVAAIVLGSVSGIASTEEISDIAKYLKENRGPTGNPADPYEPYYLTWGASDGDTTAVAVANLAPYYETNADAKTVVDEALTWLKTQQGTEGGFGFEWGGTVYSSACTTAMVVTALSESASNGIAGNTQTDWTKEGNTPVSGLMNFYQGDGVFGEGYPGTNDGMSTEQAAYALVAYDRSITPDATSLFDFSDVTAVYYIYFDGNGASNTMKTQAILGDTSKKLNANTLINSGYRFVGWKDEDGNTYTNTQLINASKDVKLYAVWERINTESEPRLSLNSYYRDSMRVMSTSVVYGDWKLSESGKWTFYIDGQQAKNRWVTAYNPAAGKYMASWFYFDANGEMLTGWQKIKDADGIERWYYLNPHPDPWYGACFRNTVTPDGYVVDASGAWIDPNASPSEEITKIIERASSEGGSATGAKTSEASGEESANTSKISVSVSVSGNVVSGSEEVTIKKNASPYDALKALAKKMGWSVSGSGSYIKGIGGEMEKSAGPQSGWTYSVNGNTPGKSAGSYKLKDGDSVDWTFVDGPNY